MSTELLKLISDNNFEEFENSCNNYLKDPNISDNFAFYDYDCHTEEFQYPLCSCKFLIQKVHRGFYVSKCNCENGKRYLLLKDSLNLLNNTNCIYVEEFFEKSDIILNDCIKIILKSGNLFLEYQSVIYDFNSELYKLHKDILLSPEILKSKIISIHSDEELDYYYKRMLTGYFLK